MFSLLIRLGLAYPFLEWGLDALRNPAHFVEYLAVENHLTAQIMKTANLEPLVIAFGTAEIALALFLAIGVWTRPTSLLSLAAFVVFSIVAAYPLALPQDISLGAAAVNLLRYGPGSFAVTHLTKKSQP